jgi:hypothetical protein
LLLISAKIVFFSESKCVLGESLRFI